MSAENRRGVVYRCPACGAELVVLARRSGAFSPRCCNCDMEPLQGKLTLYVCPACGAEIVVVARETGVFEPRCCNVAMDVAA